MAQHLEIAGQPLALLHIGAPQRELVLLARFGRERGQFRQMRQQQILVGFGLGSGCAGSIGNAARGLPRLPRRAQAGRIHPGEAVEQRAVAARIYQPAIVMLAVQFDQRRGELPQQRDADRLVVDESL